MSKIYALFKGNQIIKMTTNYEEIYDYRNSLPKEERKVCILMHKDIQTGLVGVWTYYRTFEV